MGKVRPWVQPSLTMGAIRAAKIHVEHIWGVGWCGSCAIKQEGGPFGWLEVSALTEADTDALAAWLFLVANFIAEP